MGDSYISSYEKAIQIARLVSENNGTAFFVGGFVRDRLRGVENKDIDIEIHGISPETLKGVLDALGERITIGESFGVYALKGYNIDIAMPRTEHCNGSGHRDFEVFVDADIGTLRASRRRDFTVNSIMQNVLTGEITDHFGGRDDLEKGILRHIADDTFCEDPLRVLRVAQFSARLGFEVADETVTLCRSIPLNTLPKERIEGELMKALLKADRPSVFFEVLRKMGKLSEWFAELEALIDVPQNEKYHREGDVWTHTMLVLDTATEYRETAQYPKGFMLSAVLHDVGKAECTRVVDGIAHARGHDTVGAVTAGKLTGRLSGEKQLKRYVMNMVENHMHPGNMFTTGASVKATNRLFDRCIAPKDLIYLSFCDGKGKIPQSYSDEYREFLFSRLEQYEEAMKLPYVTGEDLIKAGLEPGEEFSQLLCLAHKLRLSGVDRDTALKQVLASAGKK